MIAPKTWTGQAYCKTFITSARFKPAFLALVSYWFKEEFPWIPDEGLFPCSQGPQAGVDHLFRWSLPAFSGLMTGTLCNVCTVCCAGTFPPTAVRWSVEDASKECQGRNSCTFPPTAVIFQFSCAADRCVTMLVRPLSCRCIPVFFHLWLSFLTLFQMFTFSLSSTCLANSCFLLHKGSSVINPPLPASSLHPGSLYSFPFWPTLLVSEEERVLFSV